MDKRLREILAHHDYHSSISSNFSLFNPKDELKSKNNNYDKTSFKKNLWRGKYKIHQSANS